MVGRDDAVDLTSNHDELGRRGERLPDFAPFRRPHHGRPVLLGEARRKLDLELDALEAMRRGLEAMTLDQLNSLRRYPARVAEPEHVDTRTGRQGRKEQVEGLRSGAVTAMLGRLIGLEPMGADERVDPLASGEDHTDGQLDD